MSSGKLIAVTGATGNVAPEVIGLLLAAGQRVRAVVRNPAKATGLAERGAEIVEADLSRPRTLEHAFDGVDAVLSIAPPGPLAPQQSSAILWAARQARVGHIVRLSAFGAAHDAPTVNSRLHALSDAELERSNVPYTILKPHFFMQNLFMAAESVAKEGVMYLALGEGRMGMIDVADIAAVAAHVLTTPGHVGKTYVMTGPESIDMNAVAAAFSDAVGKLVRYQPIPVSALEQGLLQMGMDEFTRTLLCDYFTAYSNNWGDAVTLTVPELLGRPARSIRDFAAAVAPAFGKSQS